MIKTDTENTAKPTHNEEIKEASPTLAGTLAATIAFAFLVDAAKGPVFRRLGIA